MLELGIMLIIFYIQPLPFNNDMWSSKGSWEIGTPHMLKEVLKNQELLEYKGEILSSLSSKKG